MYIYICEILQQSRGKSCHISAVTRDVLGNVPWPMFWDYFYWNLMECVGAPHSGTSPSASDTNPKRSPNSMGKLMGMGVSWFIGFQWIFPNEVHPININKPTPQWLSRIGSQKPRCWRSTFWVTPAEASSEAPGPPCTLEPCEAWATSLQPWHLGKKRWSSVESPGWWLIAVNYSTQKILDGYFMVLQDFNLWPDNCKMYWPAKVSNEFLQFSDVYIYYIVDIGMGVVRNRKLGMRINRAWQWSTFNPHLQPCSSQESSSCKHRCCKATICITGNHGFSTS